MRLLPLGNVHPYVLVTFDLDWFEARKYCRQHFKDLASVLYEEHNQVLAGKLQDRQLEEAWIGLSRDSWKWLDGTTSSFRQWAPNEPNNDNNEEACVEMNGESWSDRRCDLKLNFLCQSKSRR